MRTILIIQARMGASRLPGKVLKTLGDTVVLDYVVSRCRSIQGVDEVIVATSTLPGDDAIQKWCEENKVPYYRGSETDVLSRYYECASSYQPDYVIRVTADCPFVDYELADQIIAAMREKPSDIVRVQGELPRGLVVEMVSFAALEYMYRNGKEDRHREHVTYYAYEYPEKFTSATIHPPAEICHPELRITLDTDEDYQLCQAIAAHFAGDKQVSTREAVRYLLSHPEVAALNAHIEQKPVV